MKIEWNEQEYEVDYDVYGPSGDGWNEPRDPGGIEIVRVTPDIDDEEFDEYAKEQINLLLDEMRLCAAEDRWEAQREAANDRNHYHDF